MMIKELRKQIQKIGTIRHLKKNEYLLNSGQPCQNSYYINSGILVKIFLNKNGREIIQGFYLDGEFVFLTEHNTYLPGNGQSFQIKAIENCKITEFSKSQLEYLAHNSKEFALYLQKLTALSFHNLYMFSAMRLSLKEEEFLLFLYHQYPKYLCRIPDKYIAQFMGVGKRWLCSVKEKAFNRFLKKV
ncbi:MAG: Crp/Fnr family transcriptional regulator [Salinivirgaceae bacterium]